MLTKYPYILVFKVFFCQKETNVIQVSTFWGKHYHILVIILSPSQLAPIYNEFYRAKIIYLRGSTISFRIKYNISIFYSETVRPHLFMSKLEMRTTISSYTILHKILYLYREVKGVQKKNIPFTSRDILVFLVKIIG